MDFFRFWNTSRKYLTLTLLVSCLCKRKYSCLNFMSLITYFWISVNFLIIESFSNRDYCYCFQKNFFFNRFPNFDKIKYLIIYNLNNWETLFFTMKWYKDGLVDNARIRTHQSLSIYYRFLFELSQFKSGLLLHMDF